MKKFILILLLPLSAAAGIEEYALNDLEGKALTMVGRNMAALQTWTSEPGDLASDLQKCLASSKAFEPTTFTISAEAVHKMCDTLSPGKSTVHDDLHDYTERCEFTALTPCKIQ